MISTPTAIISCTAHTMCINVQTPGPACSPQAQTEFSTSTFFCSTKYTCAYGTL